MRTHITEPYNEMKAQVKSELQDHCSYMGVTVHFINDWKFKSFCLSTKLFTVPQTSSNLANALLGDVEECKVKYKKFVVKSDGVANIKKAINDLY